MGKPVKIVMFIIITLIFLVFMAALVWSFFFDPNDYKTEIASAVKEKTGRELMMEGELKLSFFPWLGLSTGKIALSNAPGFEGQPFATMDDVEINVKLLPLFAKQIEIGRLGLKNPVLNLTRNKEGQNNWDDLTKTDASKTAPTSESDSNKPANSDMLLLFAISGIDIDNASLNWDDQQSGKRTEINNLNLKTGRFAVNEPVAVELSMKIMNAQAKLTESLKLTTDLTVNEKFDNFLFRHSELNSITEGQGVPGKSLTTSLSADVAVNWPDQTAKISGLQVKSSDVKIFADLSGTGLKDHPVFQGPVRVEPFNPAKTLKEWAVALPAMKDSNALNKLAMQFDLQVTGDSFAFENVSINLDDSQIKGDIRIKNFAEPVIAFDMDMDTLDADRYLPPAANKNKPISSPASALAAGAAIIPVEILRKLNINGELSLLKLKVSDMTMQDIHLKLNAKNGILTTQQSVKQFYQGSYAGNFSIDARHGEPILALNETLTHVHIEPLLKDYRNEAKISGIANASARLQGQGNNVGSIKSSLHGQLSFNIKDSVIRGFNLQKIIDEGKSLVKGTYRPAEHKKDQTLFSDITGTANVKQGIIRNDDLLAKSSKLRVNGKGNADLNTETLNYQIIAKLIKTEATATEPEQYHDTPIAIAVGGSFSEPTYTLDVASLLTEKNKAKIEKILDKNKDKVDKLMDKLDKKLGPGASDLLKRLF